MDAEKDKVSKAKIQRAREHTVDERIKLIAALVSVAQLEREAYHEVRPETVEALGLLVDNI